MFRLYINSYVKPYINSQKFTGFSAEACLSGLRVCTSLVSADVGTGCFSGGRAFVAASRSTYI
jgi:hypothetical protein